MNTEPDDEPERKPQHKAIKNRAIQEVSLLTIFTFVLWIGCLIIGLIGLLTGNPPAKPPTTQPQPVAAEIMDVQIATDVQPADAPAAPAPSPEIAQPSQLPSAPPLPAVAMPSPSIAFAQPVTGPVRYVTAREANPAEIPAVTPPVQQLTFGEGEARQPSPIYPREAELAGQTGSVTVRFRVEQDGDVSWVTAVSPSLWPLLNQAAVNVVRDRWRFPTGPPRIYEITFTFQGRSY